MVKARIKSTSRSTQELICAAIKRHAPKVKANGSQPDYTFTMENIGAGIELSPTVKYVLKSGIAPFDDLVGGFPFGHICEVFGLEASGKSNIVVQSCIRAQVGHIYEMVDRDERGQPVFRKLDKNDVDISVIYLDNEQALTDDKIFCDTEDNGKLVRLAGGVGNCDTVDMVFKILDVAIDTANAAELETGRKQFLVFVLDTVAATSSRDELAQEWGKMDYPRHAIEWRKGFRQLTRRIKRGNVCTIFTNQVSDNLKQQAKKGRPQSSAPRPIDYSTFGGKALKFYSHFRVFFFNTDARYKFNPNKQFPDGYQFGFVSVKNRIKKPLREGRLALRFATNPEQTNGGIHNRLSILETLIYLKHAEYDDDKKISFKFDLFDVPMTTFGEKTASIDEQDSAPKRGGRSHAYKNPSIASRGEWLEFYAAHKADFDALYASAINLAFDTDVQQTTQVVDTEGDLPEESEPEDGEPVGKTEGDDENAN